MLLAKKTDSLFYVFLKTTGILFLAIFLGLLLDSKFVIPYFPQGQFAANIAVIIIFLFVFAKSTKKIREFLIYAILIAIAGECFFSLFLEMYTYRLHDIPFYVFFGHALLYVSVLYFCKAKATGFFRKKLELSFIILVISYAVAFLVFADDYFGFVLTIITLFILKNRPKERLFYLTMYLCIAFLEIVGTWYKCWHWPAFAFHIEGKFLRSANPPSGISFFYFGLDLGCLYFYKLHHKIAWKRMKKIRNTNIKPSDKSLAFNS